MPHQTQEQEQAVCGAYKAACNLRGGQNLGFSLSINTYWFAPSLCSCLLGFAAHERAFRPAAKVT